LDVRSTELVATSREAADGGKSRTYGDLPYRYRARPTLIWRFRRDGL
jgi:hypothetical protein